MPSYLLAGEERTAWTVPISLARMASDRRSIGRLFRPYPKVSTTPTSSAANRGTLDRAMACAVQKSPHKSRSALTPSRPIQAPADRAAAECAEDKLLRTH